MTKKEAKEHARGIVHALIESYFSVGQPFEEVGSRWASETDAQKVYEELQSIQSKYR